LGTKRPLSLCLDCRISHSLVSICLKPLFRKLANGDVLPFESTNPCQASSSLSTSPSPSVEPRSFCSFVRYCTDTESRSKSLGYKHTTTGISEAVVARSNRARLRESDEAGSGLREQRATSQRDAVTFNGTASAAI